MQSPQWFDFSGLVDNKYPIQMYLDTDGHTVTGDCFFLHAQAFGVKDISLSGKIDDAGAVSVSGDRYDDDTGEEVDKVAIVGQIIGAATSRCRFQGQWKITGRTDPFMLTRRAGVGDGTVDMVHIFVDNKQIHYTEDVQYPQIESATNTSYLAFNAAALHVAESEVQDFDGAIQEGLEDAKTLPLPPASGDPIENHPYDLLVSCQEFQAGPEVISASFYSHEDSGGADMGGSDAASMNYDLKKRRFLSLSDIFRPHSAYLSLLHRLCASALIKLNPARFTRDEARGLIDGTVFEIDCQYWCLTPYGLMVTFQPDPGGPNASSDSVVVPYAVLRGVLRPEYRPS